mgnify:CR=1 FL=1
MNIKVLGTGCAKCNALEKAVREAVQTAGIQAEVEKVEDIMDILGYGISRTPGLVINDRVVLSGRVPDQKELIKLLTQ